MMRATLEDALFYEVSMTFSRLHYYAGEGALMTHRLYAWQYSVADRRATYTSFSRGRHSPTIFHELITLLCAPRATRQEIFLYYAYASPARRRRPAIYARERDDAKSFPEFRACRRYFAIAAVISASESHRADAGSPAARLGDDDYACCRMPAPPRFRHIYLSIEVRIHEHAGGRVSIASGNTKMGTRVKRGRRWRR